MLCTFEHALQASNPNPPVRSEPDPPRHLRGPITGFSRSSRRRLLRVLSTVRTSRLPPARFVTLTWHRVPDRWHADALAFREWLRRRSCVYVWRLEAQQRGAPHFHLIVWADRWSEPEAREAWSRIAAYGSAAHEEHGYNELPLESYGQVFAYAAKYCAKTDRELPPELHGHRIWGASRSLPCSATGAAPDLDERQYYALRRFASRLLRARARARRASALERGETPRRLRRARQVSPRSLHLYLRAGDAERICRWLGVELIDPLWLDPDLPEHVASARTSTPAPFWYKGQGSLFGPWGARLN